MSDAEFEHYESAVQKESHNKEALLSGEAEEALTAEEKGALNAAEGSDWRVKPLGFSLQTLAAYQPNTGPVPIGAFDLSMYPKSLKGVGFHIPIGAGLVQETSATATGSDTKASLAIGLGISYPLTTGEIVVGAMYWDQDGKSEFGPYIGLSFNLSGGREKLKRR